MSAHGIIPDAGYGGIVVTSLPAPAGITNAYVPPDSFTVSSALRFYGFNCAANKYDPQQMNAFESEMLALAVAFNPEGTWNTGSVINLSNAFAVWVENFSAGGGVTLFKAADYPSVSDLGAATPGYVTAAVDAATTTIEALIPSLTHFASYPSASDVTAATPEYVAHAVAAVTIPLTHIAAFPSSSDTSAATPAYVAAAVASVAGSLHSLTDVNVTEGPSIDAYALTWNNATGKWIASAISSGSSTLAGLSDVIITTPADSQALIYEGSGVNKWRNLSLGIMAFSTNFNDLTSKPTSASYVLSGLSDVNVTEGPGIDSYVLTWHNATGKWIASAVSAGSSSLATDTDVAISAPANGDLLAYNSGTSKWQNVTPAGIGSGNPPTLVQHKAFIGDEPYTLDAPPTPGNLLVAMVSHWSGSTAVATGWSQLVNQTASNDLAAMYVRVASSADTATLTPCNATSGSSAVVWEIDSCDLSVPIAFGVMVDHNASVTTITSGANANCLILGMFTTTVNANLPTISGGVTAGDTASAASGVGSGYGRSVAAFYETFVSPASATATATYGGSEITNAYILLIQGASAGGGASALTELSDTSISSPVIGQAFAYNGVKWANVNVLDMPSHSDGSVSGAVTVDRALSETHILSLTGNVTGLTINNWGVSGSLSKLTLIVNNTGSFGITWPTAKWAGGVAPIVTSGAGKTDIYTFITYDGGTTLYGTIEGQDFS